MTVVYEVGARFTPEEDLIDKCKKILQRWHHKHAVVSTVRLVSMMISTCVCITIMLC